MRQCSGRRGFRVLIVPDEANEVRSAAKGFMPAFDHFIVAENLMRSPAAESSR